MAHSVTFHLAYLVGREPGPRGTPILRWRNTLSETEIQNLHPLKRRFIWEPPSPGGGGGRSPIDLSHMH